MLLLSLLLVTAVLEGVTAKLFNVYFQPGMRLKRDSARQLRSLTPLQLDGSVDVGYFYTHIELVCHLPSFPCIGPCTSLDMVNNT